MSNLGELPVQCLVLCQSFETYWAYYHQSDGTLYNTEARQTARLFLEAFRELEAIDSNVVDPNALRIGPHSDVRKILKTLGDWAVGNAPYPSQMGARQSRFILFALLAGLKGYLFNKLALSRMPPVAYTTKEFQHSEAVVRWRGHMPGPALEDDPDAIFRAASSAQTIVVVGDIRRSQDLMTYAISPTEFSERLLAFITMTRKLTDQHLGLFDKFTGDGFLVYFNDSVCGIRGKKALDCLLAFLLDMAEFARHHFPSWARSIRKRPPVEIGLAMGADVGLVSFQDPQNHLIAVGDAIVWASRMASAAKAGEVLINNLLATALEPRPDVLLTTVAHETKSGEGFTAFRLERKITGA